MAMKVRRDLLTTVLLLEAIARDLRARMNEPRLAGVHWADEAVMRLDDLVTDIARDNDVAARGISRSLHIVQRERASGT